MTLPPFGQLDPFLRRMISRRVRPESESCRKARFFCRSSFTARNLLSIKETRQPRSYLEKMGRTLTIYAKPCTWTFAPWSVLTDDPHPRVSLVVSDYARSASGNPHWRCRHWRLLWSVPLRPRSRILPMMTASALHSLKSCVLVLAQSMGRNLKKG